MKWTKRHSANAVAAKLRLRIARGESELQPEARGSVYTPRRPRPDFVIQIRSKSGDRVQMSLHRFGKRFITSQGIKSAREISRGIEALIRLASV